MELFYGQIYDGNLYADQILFFGALDLYHTSPDSSDIQYKIIGVENGGLISLGAGARLAGLLPDGAVLRPDLRRQPLR